MAENERWQTELFDNAPSRTANCLSSPISGIWLVYFTYSAFNLTSTGWNDQTKVQENGRFMETMCLSIRQLF